jgi:hypothetical protein
VAVTVLAAGQVVAAVDPAAVRAAGRNPLRDRMTCHTNLNATRGQDDLSPFPFLTTDDTDGTDKGMNQDLLIRAISVIRGSYVLATRPRQAFRAQQDFACNRGPGGSKYLHYSPGCVRWVVACAFAPHL